MRKPGGVCASVLPGIVALAVASICVGVGCSESEENPGQDRAQKPEKQAPATEDPVQTSATEDPVQTSADRARDAAFRALNELGPEHTRRYSRELTTLAGRYPTAESQILRHRRRLCGQAHHRLERLAADLDSGKATPAVTREAVGTVEWGAALSEGRSYLDGLTGGLVAWASEVDPDDREATYREKRFWTYRNQFYERWQSPPPGVCDVAEIEEVVRRVIVATVAVDMSHWLYSEIEGWGDMDSRVQLNVVSLSPERVEEVRREGGLKYDRADHWGFGIADHEVLTKVGPENEGEFELAIDEELLLDQKRQLLAVRLLDHDKSGTTQVGVLFAPPFRPETEVRREAETADGTTIEVVLKPVDAAR